MPTFSEYFVQKNKELAELIDMTWIDLQEPTSQIDVYIPSTTYQDIYLLSGEILHGRSTGTMAHLLGDDQEVPSNRSLMEMLERMFTSFSAGKAVRWSSVDIEKLNLLSSIQNAAVRESIERYFFSKNVPLLAGIEDLATYFALRIACGLSIDYVDPITKARFTYTQPGMISSHIPAPLVGPALWSNPLTCTPLSNLRALSETCQGIDSTVGAVGVPDALFITRLQLAQIGRSNEMKRFRMSTSGNTATTEDETLAATFIGKEEVLDAIRLVTQIPNVVEVNAQFNQAQEVGTETIVEAFPSGMVSMVFKNNIKKAYLPTVDATGKMTNGSPAIVTRNNGSLPYKEETIAVAKTAVMAFDGRKICAQKVA